MYVYVSSGSRNVLSFGAKPFIEKLLSPFIPKPVKYISIYLRRNKLMCHDHGVSLMELMIFQVSLEDGAFIVLRLGPM